MADLAERGQILLLAALFLAATFIVLAVVVNSAIFAENLSTRDDVPGSHDALEYRADIAENTGDVLTFLNTNLDTDHATLRDRVETNTQNISQQGGLQRSNLGRVVTVDYPADAAHTTNGHRIAQDNASRNLTSLDTDDDWTLAEDVEQTRNMRFNFTHIDEGGLLETPESFRLRLDGDNGTWTLTVQRQSLFNVAPVDDVDITVERPDGDTATCTRTDPVGTSSSLTVDLVESTIDGQFCRALSRQADGTQMWFGTNVGATYDIEFDNSQAFNGTYSMVIDGEPETDNLRTNMNPDEPYVTDALYSVTLDYAYYASQVGYETDVRVAPGEVPP